MRPQAAGGRFRRREASGPRTPNPPYPSTLTAPARARPALIPGAAGRQDVRAQPVLVEGDPEARLVRHAEDAADGVERRGQQPLAERVGRAGGLADQEVGARRRQVRRRREVDRRPHADVRRPAGVVQPRHRGDPPPRADPAGAADVGQDHVDRAAGQPFRELPAGAFGLAGRHCHVERGAEAHIARHILRRQRVFEPADAEVLQPAPDVEGTPHCGAPRPIPRPLPGGSVIPLPCPPSGHGRARHPAAAPPGYHRPRPLRGHGRTRAAERRASPLSRPVGLPAAARSGGASEGPTGGG